MKRQLIILSLGLCTALGALIWQSYSLRAEAEQLKVEWFNKGWSDSKLDDCQQGYKSACDWLNTTK